MTPLAKFIEETAVLLIALGGLGLITRPTRSLAVRLLIVAVILTVAVGIMPTAFK